LYSQNVSHEGGTKMTNKKVRLRILALALIFITGGAFAQEAETTTGTTPQNDGAGVKTPKNVVTLDIGPIIIGVGIKTMGKMMSDGEEGLSSSGFGIGAQYERQIFDKLGVGGRFAYLGGGIGLTEDGSALAMKLSSFSFEGHARFYPGKKGTFFLDGMVGLAIMSASFEGKFRYEDKHTEHIDFRVSRGFFKLGGKLGWRIDFGKPGGFMFEPSIGYYAGIGLGDTLGKKLSKELDEDVTEFDDIFSLIQNFIFVGGPRVSLAFGWRF
jgi:hypothetical protein